MVSVIIPTREKTPELQGCMVRTVQDVLQQSRGEIEVLLVLDGLWPTVNLPQDPRLRVLHKGQAEGMRPAINDAARIARGRYLLKLDAHCALADGFDVILTAQCPDDAIVVPRRYRLDPQTWAPDGSAPIDAHYLSADLHGVIWPERAKERAHILLDEEMSSQGSCWLMSTSHWDHLGGLCTAGYGTFTQEFQELGLKTWLRGGQVFVNKATWYAHLHKGKTYGRGYDLSASEVDAGAAFTRDYWLNDRDPQATRTLRWLVDRFAPVPTWNLEGGAIGDE